MLVLGPIGVIDGVKEDHTFSGAGRMERMSSCWSGDTRAWTLRGPKTFQELTEKREDIAVLTQSDRGTLCFRTMRSPRLTRKKMALVEIEFTNGTKVRCTPDHNICLREGRKVKAADLKAKDSIASCYRYRANSKGYLRLDNGRDFVLEHWVVAEFEYGRRPDYPHEHVHHRDENKQNNTPENIEILPARKHNALNMLGEKNPMSGVWDKRNPLFGRPVDGKNNGRYRHDIKTKEIVAMCEAGISKKEIWGMHLTKVHTTYSAWGYGKIPQELGRV